MDPFDRRRVLRDATILAAAFVVLLGIGTLLFVLAGEDDADTAFFRAIGAVTTNDFVGDAPDPGGERVVAAALAVAGGLFYLALVGSVVRTLLLPGVAERLRQRWARRRVAHLRGHYVVCGYGNIGRAAVDALQKEGKTVVVIDRNQANAREAERAGAKAICGEAHDDGVLEAARIKYAAALVATVASDAENLYIGIAAKRLRPDIVIVARASTDAAQKNMQRAGVLTDVSTPYIGAGRQLADSVRRQVEAAPADA